MHQCCCGWSRTTQPRSGFSKHIFTRGWLVGLALVPLVSLAASTDSTAVPKLFEKYCYECHGDGAKKGGIELDTLVGAPPAKNHREWERKSFVSATPDSTGSQSDADDRNIQDRKMKF